HGYDKLDCLACGVAGRVFSALVERRRADVLRVVRVQDRGGTGSVTIAADSPDNAVAGSVGADDRAGAGEGGHDTGLRGGRGAELAIFQAELLEGIAVAPEVDVAVPIRGRAPESLDLAVDLLRDVVVAGVEAAEVVTIEHLDTAVLAD